MKSRVEPDIIALLRAGREMDKYQAAALAYCCVKHAAKILKRVKRRKDARIVRWERTTRQVTPVYGLYDGKRDVERPPKRTSADKSRERRKNQELRDKDNARQRLKRAQRRAQMNVGVKIPSLASMLQGTQ